MFNFVGLLIRNDASLYTYLQSTGHNTTVDKVLGYTQFIGQCLFYFLLHYIECYRHTLFLCSCMYVLTHVHSHKYLHMQKYMHSIHQRHINKGVKTN